MPSFVVYCWHIKAQQKRSLFSPLHSCDFLRGRKVEKEENNSVTLRLICQQQKSRKELMMEVQTKQVGVKKKKRKGKKNTIYG